jgi:translocation protein SEC72
MYPRARRFGNAYAFAIVDILFTIFWFSAWVAVASYVAGGKSAGLPDDDKDKDKDKKTGCDAFGYGSPGKCKLSTGTVILGVVVL